MKLQVENVVVGYVPGQRILRNLSMEAEEQKTTCVIGPNGAGKSTLLKTIYGFLTPSEGRILVDGENLTGKRPDAMLRKGIGYLSQDKEIFPYLSVEENLTMACWTLPKDEIKPRVEEAYTNFPALRSRRKNRATSLSGGERGMLVFSMLMITKPKVLLLDEPTAGLAPIIAKGLCEELSKRKGEGLTIVLVDQNIREAVETGDYIYTMEMGKNGAQGPKNDFLEKEETLIRKWLLA